MTCIKSEIISPDTIWTDIFQEENTLNMKYLWFYFVALTTLLISGNDHTCKRCHPVIYAEFHNSMHKKSSIYSDKVHQSIWDLHPSKAKGEYKCAKCHTPNAKTEEEQKEGISCVSCHTISDVTEHARSNKNIYTDETKTFFSAQPGKEQTKLTYQTKSTFMGMFKTTTGSPHHDIDYRNENYYTGKVCMGCHSHKQNAHSFEVCRTDSKGAQNKEQNCITCHMPQVKGSATTIQKTKTHAFHGFAGVYTAPEMLSRYIGLDFKKSEDGFTITVTNKAPHNLLLHPLRVLQLKAILKREGKTKTLKTYTFVKTLGHEGRPAMPWEATEIHKDTMIKANEERTAAFDEPLQKGDTLEVTLGFYAVNPKVVEKLGLQEETELTRFKTLKHQFISVK